VTHGFTADSEANLSQGRAERIIRDVPAAVVRCGIDLERYAQSPHTRQETRQSLDIPPHHAVVLALAALKPQKDPETWVRAASRVLRVEPDTTFIWAGDGELRGQVVRLIERLSLRSRVRLLGWRQDVADLLHASDILLLTSLWEGLPQAIMQAMAAGVPVVATDVDGTPEAVRHRDNGLLIPPGRPDEAAAAVVALLRETVARRSMGKQGRAMVEQFSADHMMAALDRFYAAVIEGIGDGSA